MNCDQLIQMLKVLFNNKQNKYTMYGEGISVHFANELRRLHKLSHEHKILYYSRFLADTKTNLIFTDKGISYYFENRVYGVKLHSSIRYIPWNEIDRVEFAPNNSIFKNDQFYFYLDKDADNYFKFTKHEVTHYECDPKKFEKTLNAFIKSFYSTENYVELIDQAAYEGRYDDILSLCERFEKDFSDSEYTTFISLHKGIAYYLKAEDNKNEDETKTLLKKACNVLRLGISEGSKEDNELITLSHLYLSKCTTDVYERYKSLILGLELPDEEIKLQSKGEIKNLLRLELFNNFYKDNDVNKEFVFFVKDINQISGCSDPKGVIKWIFPITNYPDQITFPKGHPKPNTLYIKSPIQSSYYYPFEDSTDQMFIDEIGVFSLLCQGLGASKIRFKRINGLTINEQQQNLRSVNGNIDYKIFKGDIDYNSTDKENYQSSNADELMREERYSPMRYPYVQPECIPWIEANTEWKRLMVQRLQGNLIFHTQKVSTSESIYKNNHNLHDLKTSIKYLMFKAGGSYNDSMERKYSRQQNSEWEIFVEFKPLTEFKK